MGFWKEWKHSKTLPHWLQSGYLQTETILGSEVRRPTGRCTKVTPVLIRKDSTLVLRMSDILDLIWSIETQRCHSFVFAQLPEPEVVGGLV
jgi:hypothetical protein